MLWRKRCCVTQQMAENEVTEKGRVKVQRESFAVVVSVRID